MADNLSTTVPALHTFSVSLINSICVHFIKLMEQISRNLLFLKAQGNQITERHFRHLPSKWQCSAKYRVNLTSCDSDFHISLLLYIRVVMKRSSLLTSDSVASIVQSYLFHLHSVILIERHIYCADAVATLFC